MTNPAVGISAYLADQWLDTLSNVPYTVSVCAFALHTGIPGAAGTENASATTLRVPGTFAAAAGGSFGFTGLPPIWSSMAAAETISYLSAWDALTAGNFLFSGQLLVPKTVAVGDQFALAAFTLSFAGQASG
ncbi:MAG: hypothetical protein RBS21_00385 [Corynebacterium sp.]|jgi:hypothetical protein|nr:hypothetical protein [Corynebacterium sp.]